MKRILKKLLVIILIFLTINTVVLESRCYAVDPVGAVLDAGGKALETIGKGIVGILALPIQIVVLFIGKAINLLTAGIAYLDGAVDGADTATTITPFEILFNKIKLVDINIFDLSDPDSIVGQIRGGVATWYYVLRMIATAILLVILIYVGIRMALSTVASDKAMYKKVLVDWACSLGLIFLLQYIILFTLNVNTAIVGAMEKVTSQTDGISDTFDAIASASIPFGANGIASAAVYFILVTQTIGLLISYINRMLKISFLIIVSPLITLTYSIDKMGDGKAQALGTWLKEFVFSVLIQPFHCVIYMVMVSTALNLLVENTGDLGYAILAILCIKFIQDAEKIVRKIFHFEDDNSGTSVAAGMATSALLLSQSKNIGKNLKTGVTGIKNMKTNASNLLTHAKTDLAVVGAIASGRNTKRVEVKHVNEETGQEETTVETQKMSMAELREEAMAKQINKQADKIAKKVYGDKEAKGKYSANNMNLDSKEDKERLAALKSSGMSHSKAMATLRKERLEQAQKKQKEAKHPTITRARSTMRAISQMETFKDIGSVVKTYASLGTGVATAMGLWGNGSNAITAISSGAAAYSATKEFMKNTNKTLVNTAVQSVMALGAKSKEDVSKMLADIGNMDSTDFDKDSTELKNLLDNLKQQLMNLGMNETSATRYSNTIQNQVKSNAAKGNPKSIQEILKDNIDSYNDSPESARNKINLSTPEVMDKFNNLQSATLGYSDFENKKIIYENIQKAAQTSGMTVETYISETSKEFDRLKGTNAIDETFYSSRDTDSSEESNSNSNNNSDTNPPDGESSERIEIPEEKREEIEGFIQREVLEALDKNNIDLEEQLKDQAEIIAEKMEDEAKLLIEEKIQEIERIYKIENEHERNERLVDLEINLMTEYNTLTQDGKDSLAVMKSKRTKEEDKPGLVTSYARTEFQRAALQGALNYLEDKKGE